MCRHLSGELSQEWDEKEKAAVEVDGMRDETLFRKLLDLVMHIVPYLMAHNAEAEACDLLMDISQLDLLEQFTDESVQARVCLYLKRSVTSHHFTICFCLCIIDWIDYY